MGCGCYVLCVCLHVWLWCVGRIAYLWISDSEAVGGAGIKRNIKMSQQICQWQKCFGTSFGGNMKLLNK